MPDILDEIIDKLSPTTLKMMLDFNSDSVKRNNKLNNLLKETQNMKIRQTNRELERKVYDIKSKTAENRNYLTRLKNELEVLKSLKQPVGNQQSIKAYAERMKELEIQVKNLTKDHDELNLTELFNEVENLNKQIQDYKNKISEESSKYKCYNGFSPNMEEAKEIVSNMRERIKYKESIVESLYK